MRSLLRKPRREFEGIMDMDVDASRIVWSQFMIHIKSFLIAALKLLITKN